MKHSSLKERVIKQYSATEIANIKNWVFLFERIVPRDYKDTFLSFVMFELS
jgi:hypothetical protein